MINSTDLIKAAQELISLQIDGLNNLSKRFNKEFVNVIKLINNSKGKLVIIALGKSGIIGKKISATLNSTGTSASFIHASDALHGDLGSIQVGDVVMFISKSGRTNELLRIIPYLKKNDIPIISLTCDRPSPLAQNSDFNLTLEISREACHNNLAPTTSTTMQLVMGDVIAVCLSKIKNFRDIDFAEFHPSGTLGNKLTLKVCDFCDFKNVPKVNTHSKLSHVIIEMSKNKLGATVVLESNIIVGIITDGDLRRMLEKKSDYFNITAKDLMSSDPKKIQKDDLLYDAFLKMKNNNITQLIVVDDEEYSGIVHIHDILKLDVF
tara:strand:- start:9874 stop:10839 length:966 start_codon:yes stop_codon:yes gene_type:complete